jgi:hypothetical protein
MEGEINLGPGANGGAIGIAYAFVLESNTHWRTMPIDRQALAGRPALPLRRARRSLDHQVHASIASLSTVAWLIFGSCAA